MPRQRKGGNELGAVRGLVLLVELAQNVRTATMVCVGTGYIEIHSNTLVTLLSALMISLVRLGIILTQGNRRNGSVPTEGFAFSGSFHACSFFGRAVLVQSLLRCATTALSVLHSSRNSGKCRAADARPTEVIRHLRAIRSPPCSALHFARQRRQWQVSPCLTAMPAQKLGASLRRGVTCRSRERCGMRGRKEGTTREGFSS